MGRLSVESTSLYLRRRAGAVRNQVVTQLNLTPFPQPSASFKNASSSDTETDISFGVEFAPVPSEENSEDFELSSAAHQPNSPLICATSRLGFKGKGICGKHFGDPALSTSGQYFPGDKKHSCCVRSIHTKPQIKGREVSKRKVFLRPKGKKPFPAYACGRPAFLAKGDKVCIGRDVIPPDNSQNMSDLIHNPNDRRSNCTQTIEDKYPLPTEFSTNEILKSSSRTQCHPARSPGHGVFPATFSEQSQQVTLTLHRGLEQLDSLGWKPSYSATWDNAGLNKPSAITAQPIHCQTEMKIPAEETYAVNEKVSRSEYPSLQQSFPTSVIYPPLTSCPDKSMIQLDNKVYDGSQIENRIPAHVQLNRKFSQLLNFVNYSEIGPEFHDFCMNTVDIAEEHLVWETFSKRINRNSSFVANFLYNYVQGTNRERSFEVITCLTDTDKLFTIA
ncbi:hypothetical protein CRM22_002901 [Opisthorchis felineus]|uniref:Uncharacterized protein n=1 Tax=Opisthorchis felineus TaxID=147828 RepID=A0A4S2M3U7_OPIFE|nr:hypothetical protein CRM22_002901 [Opisthorchis felineus]